MKPRIRTSIWWRVVSQVGARESLGAPGGPIQSACPRVASRETRFSLQHVETAWIAAGSCSLSQDVFTIRGATQEAHGDLASRQPQHRPGISSKGCQQKVSRIDKAADEEFESIGSGSEFELKYIISRRSSMVRQCKSRCNHRQIRKTEEVVTRSQSEEGVGSRTDRPKKLLRQGGWGGKRKKKEKVNTMIFAKFALVAEFAMMSRSCHGDGERLINLKGLTYIIPKHEAPSQIYI